MNMAAITSDRLKAQKKTLPVWAKVSLTTPDTGGLPAEPENLDFKSSY